MSEKRTGEPVTVVSVKAKAREVKVLLSNGEKLSLSVDSFTEFHIYAGKELSDKELEAIMAYSRQDEAYDRALRYVVRDVYSVAEIERKLRDKEFPEDVIKEVVARLTKAGLLDDVHFAKVYAEDVADLRLLGRHRILADLREKGVSQTIIATLTFAREDELDKALRYAATLDRRYYRTPYGKKIIKINRSLLERGFDEDVAHEASQASAKPSDPDVEQAELERAFRAAHVKYSRKYEGFELSKRIFASLARKGFPYDEIKAIMEANDL